MAIHTQFRGEHCYREARRWRRWRRSVRRMSAHAAAVRPGAEMARWSPQVSAGNSDCFQADPVKRSCPGSIHRRPIPCQMSSARCCYGKQLDSWITPNNKFFTVQHYNKPVIDPQTGSWRSAGWSRSR